MTLPTDYTNATILDDVHPDAHNETNAAVNDLDARVDAIVDADRRLAVIETRLAAADLAVGVPSLDRASIATSFTMANNRPYLTWITAPANMTVTKIRTYSGTSAASGNANVEVGIYREETDLSLTLVEKTANLAGVIYTTADTAYEPALLSPVALTAGKRYALAVVVSGGVAGSGIASPITAPFGNEYALAPRRSAYRTPNVANLPTTVPVANMAAAAILYLVALP